ncbi:MAG: sensor histidine kinase [Lachnospira sp.]
MNLAEIIMIVFLELVRVLITISYFKIFYDSGKKSINMVTGGVSFLLTTCCYLCFDNGLLNIASTLIGIVIVSLGFKGRINRKILLSVMCYALMFSTDVMAFFMNMRNTSLDGYAVVSSSIAVLLYYLAVIIIKVFFRKKTKTEFSGQWYILLLVSVMSVCLLYVVYHEMHMSGNAIILVSFIILILNFLLFFFYSSMLDRFKYEREVNVLKQQMGFYENQIKLNIENDKKLRSIRHDMKHHIREIRGLAENRDYSGIKEYTDNISQDIKDSEKVYNTGNIALDGILNYYANRFVEKNIKNNIKITIPENLSVKAYDMNIILGNLLDNAIENTVRADEPKVSLQLKYNGGLLHILVENSFDGRLNKEGGVFLSIKGDEHGYGLENIRRIVDKYNGNMLITDDNNVFSVGIVMFISH